MKIRSLLFEGWTLYRQHFLLISAVVVTIWLPCELLSSYADYHIFDPENFRQSFKLAQLLDNFFGIIAFTAVVTIALNLKTGTPPSYGHSLNQGLVFWGKMWWTRFICGLAIILSLLLLIIPGLYLLARLSLAETVVVTEGTYGTDAMKRSFQLTQGLFWKIAGLACASVAVVLVPILIVILPGVFIEALDVCWLDALSNLLADILIAYDTVVFVCAYHVLTTERLTANTSLVA